MLIFKCQSVVCVWRDSENKATRHILFVCVLRDRFLAVIWKEKEAPSQLWSSTKKNHQNYREMFLLLCSLLYRDGNKNLNIKIQHIPHTNCFCGCDHIDDMFGHYKNDIWFKAWIIYLFIRNFVIICVEDDIVVSWALNASEY